MNNLEINREAKGAEIVLNCTGRLDANNAGYLNDYIDRLIREGHYQITLDLLGVDYLSSAGIRSLVTQYKNLTSINGSFCITAMSENVSEVLNMVWMVEMLSHPSEAPAPADSREEIGDYLEVQGFKFRLSTLPGGGKTRAIFFGQPELTLQSGYQAKDARLIKSEENLFAIGLGAIGNSFDDCKNRFGEYIMLGKNIAYFPADGSRKPDYMLSAGQLVASLTELYGLHFEGNFSHLIRYDSENHLATIGLSQIVEGIHQLTGYKQFALVQLAESGGLIGTSLNESPVDGKKIFTYPELKETINFTTEPAHNKMLTLSVGYFTNNANKEEELFLRPIKPESQIQGHIHTTVFPYIPLKKTNIDLHEIIEYLFSTSELTDILHLTNDTRQHIGLGESQFVQGFCWIVPIESNTHLPSN